MLVLCSILVSRSSFFDLIRFRFSGLRFRFSGFWGLCERLKSCPSPKWHSLLHHKSSRKMLKDFTGLACLFCVACVCVCVGLELLLFNDCMMSDFGGTPRASRPEPGAPNPEPRVNFRFPDGPLSRISINASCSFRFLGF